MLDMNNSLWRASAVNTPQLSPLTASIAVDVAIVGAGFTGLSCALHLAERGYKVAVLEAQSVGFGGSGRNVGLANAGLWMRPDDVEALMGKEPAQRLYEALAQAPETVFSLIERYNIECEATRNGTMHVAVGAAGVAEIKRRYDQLSARHAPVQLFDKATTDARTGSTYFEGALFDPRAGTIQPLAYAHGLALAVQALGVPIHISCEVTDIQRAENQQWRLSCPNGHTVTAKQIVMATNAYSEKLFPELKQSFVPIQYSQFASEPMTPTQLEQVLPNKEGLWDTCTVMSSLRLDQSGRFIFGGMGGMSQGASGLRQWADARVKILYPKLGKLNWQYAWSGTIAYSDDHLPHCHVLAEGVYSLIGYSGRGIGPGTVMGKALAHYLAGEKEALPVAITPIETVLFRQAKTTFYEVGAHVYHLGQRWR